MENVARLIIMIKQVFKILLWILGSQLPGRTELSYKVSEHNYSRLFCFRILPDGLEISQAKPKDRNRTLKVLGWKKKRGEGFIFLRSFVFLPLKTQTKVKEIYSGVLGPL